MLHKLPGTLQENHWLGSAILPSSRSRPPPTPFLSPFLSPNQFKLQSFSLNFHNRNAQAMCYTGGERRAFSASPQKRKKIIIKKKKIKPCPLHLPPHWQRSGNCRRAGPRRGAELWRGPRGVGGSPAAAALPGGPGLCRSSPRSAPLSPPLPPPPPPAAADTPAGREREENERGSRGCLGKGGCGVWTKPLRSTPTRPSLSLSPSSRAREMGTAMLAGSRRAGNQDRCLPSTVGCR